jgi:hypothetical protein
MHQVKLTNNHKRILLEAILESELVKKRKLRNPSSIKGMEEEYYKAAKRIAEESHIECGRRGHKAGDNLFGWLRDQIFHSGDLSLTEFGQLAISICEAAGDGEYDKFTQMTIINKLFE